MKRGLLCFLVLLIILLPTGCAKAIPNDYLLQQNKTQKAMLATDLDNILNESVIAVHPPSGSVSDNNSIQISFSGANPFSNLMINSFWQYYVFELYRGAMKLELSSMLEYNANLIWENEQWYNMEIAFPQIVEESLFALSFNSYYLNRLLFLNEVQDRLLENLIIDNLWRQTRLFRNTGLYAYYWADFFSVIIEEEESIYGPYNKPICDNFQLSTGLRLSMDDIFSVDYCEYSVRIGQSLRKITPDYPECFLPWYENGTESIPLPKTEGFMITPIGLAIIYGVDEIAATCEGAVILYVNYEDIIDILNINPRLVSED